MSDIKTVARGYVPEDEKFFSEGALKILRTASRDIKYLVDQGYPIKNASVFVGNHYTLSERQRLALVRSISSDIQLEVRKQKEISVLPEGAVLFIDGFNTVITLEVAFSGSPVFECMDGTVRDLAGLRGTYRLIDKTDLAVNAIGEFLSESRIKKAVFYLDSPVSNSGRLGKKIKETFEKYSFETEVIIMNEVDYALKQINGIVVSSDAIILDNCMNWYNMSRRILEKEDMMKNAYNIF